MRLRIGVDLDKCLREFIFGFFQFHNQRYNTSFTFSDMNSYQFEHIIGGTREDALQKINQFNQTPYFRELPVVFGSQQSIRELSKKNDLFIITASLEKVKKETDRWET